MAGRDMPTWALAPGAVFGLAIATLGLALACDYRGVATWHSERTVALFWPLQRRLRRVPPWRWLLPQTREQAVRQQRAVGRSIGCGFSLAGLFIAVVCVLALIMRLA